MCEAERPTLTLLRRAQAGDQVALSQLFAHVMPRVRQIVALRIRQKARQILDVDDVLQDVLLKAFRSFDQYVERSDATFINWLARCAETVVLDALKKFLAAKHGGGKVKVVSEYDSDVLRNSIFISREPSPSAAARSLEFEQQAEEALLALPDRQREVIVLRKLCGMSYAEIAHELDGIQEGTARQLCHRALQRLREQLAVT